MTLGKTLSMKYRILRNVSSNGSILAICIVGPKNKSYETKQDGSYMAILLLLQTIILARNYWIWIPAPASAPAFWTRRIARILLLLISPTTTAAIICRFQPIGRRNGNVCKKWAVLNCVVCGVPCTRLEVQPLLVVPKTVRYWFLIIPMGHSNEKSAVAVWSWRRTSWRDVSWTWNWNCQIEWDGWDLENEQH